MLKRRPNRRSNALTGQLRSGNEGGKLGTGGGRAEGHESAVGGGLEHVRVVVSGGGEQTFRDVLGVFGLLDAVVDAAEEHGLGRT